GGRTVPGAGPRALVRPSALEQRRELPDEPGELPALVPARDTQGDLADTRLEVGPEMLGALGRRAGGRPGLHVSRVEVGRVVGVEEPLRLLEGRRAILLDVDVVVRGVRERLGITTQLRRLPSYVGRPPGDLGRVGQPDLPAIGVASDP